MSIATYEDLKKEIIDWSHRGDIDLKVATFISLAESAMYSNPDAILSIRGQETRSTATTSGRYLELPPNFQEMRSIRLDAADVDGVELRQKAPAQMIYEKAPAMPTAFTVTDQIEFNCTPDSDYTIEVNYYAIAEALSDASPTNFILDKYPNIYLYGALWCFYDWAIEEQLAAKYYGYFVSAIRGANKLAKKGRYGPSPAMTVSGNTP